MNSEARNPLPNWIGIPTNTCALFAGILIILMMIHVAVDVFCRIVLNAPLYGTLEIVAGYYMVAVVFLPLAYVSGGEGHIFIELFTSKLPFCREEFLCVIIERASTDSELTKIPNLTNSPSRCSIIS